MKRKKPPGVFVAFVQGVLSLFLYPPQPGDNLYQRPS